MDSYKVTGGFRVAGVEPGGTVTTKVLEEAGANVGALIEGGHLELIEKGAGAKQAGEAKA